MQYNEIITLIMIVIVGHRTWASSGSGGKDIKLIKALVKQLEEEDKKNEEYEAKISKLQEENDKLKESINKRGS